MNSTGIGRLAWAGKTKVSQGTTQRLGAVQRNSPQSIAEDSVCRCAAAPASPLVGPKPSEPATLPVVVCCEEQAMSEEAKSHCLPTHMDRASPEQSKLQKARAAQTQSCQASWGGRPWIHASHLTTGASLGIVTFHW